jgi:hypothetical protein
MHEVAFVDEADAGSSAERCDDRRVAEDRGRIFDGRDIRLDLCLLLQDEGFLRIDLLLRDGERADLFEAFEVALRIGEKRFIERLLGRCLVELSL